MPSDRFNTDDTASRPPESDGSAGDSPPTTRADSLSPGGDATTASRPGGAVPRVGSLGRFGKYELIDEFPGGMGVVYRAADPDLNRIVALKMLRAAPRTRPRDHERFLREARTIAALHHEYIISIHDFGEVEGQPYFTTDFIERGSLARNLEQFRGDERRAVEFMEKAARAVHHAHENNILHRDLKPGNILISDRGEPLISDFGLARMIDQDVLVTVEGSVMGTPAYMSPEQAQGKVSLVGVRSDVWSLGVVLYEVLCGQRPFPGTSRDSITQRVLHEAPQPLRAENPRIDRVLEAIVLRCLEKDPAARYPSAAALADDLRAWLGREKVQAWEEQRRARRRKLLIAGFGATCLLGLVVAAVVLLVPKGPPHDTLEAMQSELKRAGELNLLDGDGRARRGRWIGRDGSLTEPKLPAEPLRLEAQGPRLFELLSDTGGDRFRFRARLRQEGGSGEIGIYALHSTEKGLKGSIHCFVRASIQDGAADRDNKLSVWVMAVPEAGTVQPNQSFGSRLLAPGREREMSLEVRPDQVRWGDEPTQFQPLNQLPQLFSRAVRTLDDFNVRPAFPTRGGIGIYLRDCQVSVLEARVERIR